MKTVALEELVGSVIAVFIDEAPEMEELSSEARAAARALRESCDEWTEELVYKIGNKVIEAIDAATDIIDAETKEEDDEKDSFFIS